MPQYLFQKGKKVVEVFCPVSDLALKVRMMKRLGYNRLFTAPNVVVVPGYREAYEESEGVLRERKVAARRRKAAADRVIAEGLRDEGLVDKRGRPA